jgi:hypothetical protein
MDPFAILGIAPGAADRELSAAYRELAKRWHPDRGGGEEAARRMAEINAAYDLLRAGEQHAATSRPAAAPAAEPRGEWPAGPLRRALGPELVEALGAEETVRLVCPASTWASPRSILAVTERRLLWLLAGWPPSPSARSAARGIPSASCAPRRRRRSSATSATALPGRCRTGWFAAAAD